eukprot:TRINITY_DN93_c0_g2_i1.p1 TRINITY_DN93_c0_g2~~TRINITY_DN93_c0_g2_i1.p1  ORF type:complete len:615 (+),score=202.15 TRINITY_DN93_c0_g2_i1:55-1845(+)
MRAGRVAAVAAAVCGASARLGGPNSWDFMGPRWLEDGTLQFNVWGPKASSCSVKCGGQTTTLQKSGDMFTGSAPCAAGSQYTLNLGDGDKIDYLGRDITQDGSQSVVPQPYSFSSQAVHIDKSKIIVYEMHIGSFTSEGTFDAASGKLQYLADLGVTMLELMPVMDFCGNAGGWGYNPCAPWAVKPELGGSVGLKKFVDAANQRGMGVMLDVVFNHLDGSTELVNYGGDDFFFTDSRRNTPWGPRPNYDSDYVREQFLVGNTKMWMDEYHVTGFRWDSTICIRQGGGSGHCWDKGEPAITNGWKLMVDGNNLAHGGSYTGTFTVAEDNENWGGITRPTSAGGAGFDGQWGYKFFYDVVGELTKAQTTSVDMGKVAAACSFDNGGDPNQVTFTENHDQASNQNPGRIPHRLQPGGGAADWWTAKKSMLGIGMVLTCRGFPMLLQGQEYLEQKGFDYPKPPKIDWSQTSSTFVKEVQDIAALRTNKWGNSAGLLGGLNSGGKTLMVSNTGDDKVAVIHRWGPGGDAIVIFNFHEKYYKSYVLKGVPYDGRWTKRFDGDAKTYAGFYDGACDWAQYADISGGTGGMCVPKMSMIILTRD